MNQGLGTRLVNGSKRVRIKGATTMGDVNIGRAQHAAPVVPDPRDSLQQRATPPIARPTHIGPVGSRRFHGDNQPSNNINMGWSDGPYRWYGPRWRRIPACVRARQSEIQSEMGKSDPWDEMNGGRVLEGNRGNLQIDL